MIYESDKSIPMDIAFQTSTGAVTNKGKCGVKVFVKESSGKKVSVKRSKLKNTPSGGTFRVNVQTKEKLKATKQYQILAYTYCDSSKQKHALAIARVKNLEVTSGSAPVGDDVKALPEVYTPGSGSGSFGSASSSMISDAVDEDDYDEDDDEDDEDEEDEEDEENEDGKDEEEEEADSTEDNTEDNEDVHHEEDVHDEHEEEPSSTHSEPPPPLKPTAVSSNDKSLADGKVAAAAAAAATTGFGGVSFEDVTITSDIGDQKFGTIVGIIVGVLAVASLFFVAVHKRCRSSGGGGGGGGITTLLASDGSNMSLDIPASFGRVPSTVGNSNFELTMRESRAHNSRVMNQGLAPSPELGVPGMILSPVNLHGNVDSTTLQISSSTLGAFESSNGRRQPSLLSFFTRGGSSVPVREDLMSEAEEPAAQIAMPNVTNDISL